MTREDELYAPMPATGSDDDITRRVFVHHLTFLGGGVVLLGGCKDDKPAATAPVTAPVTAPPTVSTHKTFTDAEWATLRFVMTR